MTLELTNSVWLAAVNAQNFNGSPYIELGLKSCNTLPDYKGVEYPNTDQIAIYSSLMWPVSLKYIFRYFKYLHFIIWPRFLKASAEVSLNTVSYFNKGIPFLWQFYYFFPFIYFFLLFIFTLPFTVRASWMVCHTCCLTRQHITHRIFQVRDDYKWICLTLWEVANALPIGLKYFKATG